MITFLAHRFAFDTVSQLDQDTSAALATIREWRNSLVPINRVPPEVLSLIPAHFPSGNDLLRATSVCRRWRRTFIQHASLWSQVNLTVDKNPLFVKMILERAKGSALDINSSLLDADTLALLSPHTQRFRSLKLVFDNWGDIQGFSEVTPEPLPLLDTLDIYIIEFDVFTPGNIDPPSLPLFRGAVNLKKFLLRTKQESYLNHFAFPNLTTFELKAAPDGEEFPASQLLDFLEATPTLQTVHITIKGEISLAGVPPGRIVVLSNAKNFSVARDEPEIGRAHSELQSLV